MKLKQTDFFFSALILAVTAGLGYFFVWVRPEFFHTASFLFNDAAHNLLVSDHLLKGERLYRDIHYFYGPVPAYLLLAAVKWFGNTILSYNLFHFGLNLLGLFAAYFLLRRFVSASIAFGVALFGLLPAFIAPGSPLGGAIHAPYIPLERLLLLGMGLLWQPPEKRSYRRAVMTGVVLGLWQGVKFGGAIFAAAALLLMDILILIQSRADRKTVSNWLRWCLAMTAVFAAIEIFWIAAAYTFLPPAVAWDALFPAYHIEICKATMEKGEPRWPEWGSWQIFTGHYLIPFSAVLLALVAFFKPSRDFSASPRNDMKPGLYFYFLFYLLGCFAYFQHIYTFRNYMWMLVLPAAYFFENFKGVMRGLAGLLWLPGLLLMVKIIFVNPSNPALESLPLPSGERILTDAKTAETVRGILGFLEKTPASKEKSIVLFIRLGAGFHHFFGIPHLPRQVWFTKGHVRPYDQETLRSSLDQVRAVVVEEQQKPQPGVLPADPCSLIAVSPFPKDICEGLSARLNPPVRLESGFWLYAPKPAETISQS